MVSTASTWIALAVALGLFLCIGCAGTPDETEPVVLATLAPLGDSAAVEDGPVPGATYLAPNARDVDGTGAFIHYERDDMPLRVNVDLPRQSARYASPEETRRAIIEGMLVWGRALQRVMPWFAMEFVTHDERAAVQTEWKRRLTGSAAGRGGIGWAIVDGRVRVRSVFEYSTQPCLDVGCQLTAEELRYLVAHEFGHCLGLMHCLDCDSAMNYSWATRDRVLVTDLDVLTLRALMALPNGTRTDGQRLLGLQEGAAAPAPVRGRVEAP